MGSRYSGQYTLDKERVKSCLITVNLEAVEEIVLPDILIGLSGESIMLERQCLHPTLGLDPPSPHLRALQPAEQTSYSSD